jgi:hypothetical protein
MNEFPHEDSQLRTTSRFHHPLGRRNSAIRPQPREAHQRPDSRGVGRACPSPIFGSGIGDSSHISVESAAGASACKSPPTILAAVWKGSFVGVGEGIRTLDFQNHKPIPVQ